MEGKAILSYNLLRMILLPINLFKKELLFHAIFCLEVLSINPCNCAREFFFSFFIPAPTLFVESTWWNFFAKNLNCNGFCKKDLLVLIDW